MATGTKDVFKAAKQRFIPLLEDLGFNRYRRTNSFVKRVGDIYHFISLISSQWGGAFYVYVHAWVPELESVNAKNVFQNGLNNMQLGGRLSPHRVDEGSYSWDYGDENHNLEMLDRISELLVVNAMPWFACMSSRAAIAKALKSELDAAALARVKAPQSMPDFGIDDRADTKPYDWKPGQLNAINADSWWSQGDDQAFLDAGGDQLVSFMLTQGFELQRAPVLRFLRQQGPFYQVLTLESVSHGVHMNIRIYTWSEDAAAVLYGDTAKIDLDDDFYQVNGGFLGTQGIDAGDMAWLVAGKQALTLSIPALIEAIEKWAIPWYSGIADKAAFADSLLPNQLPGERYAELVGRLLK